ncbi:MAG: hypothetical protein GWP19_02985 [Planctomycetia bacterium]|nr:hypothetical protein [Planctomycetia bacterium]
MGKSPIKKGTEVNLTIESLAFGGKDVSKVADFVIFVKNAIHWETVSVIDEGVSDF